MNADDFITRVIYEDIKNSKSQSKPYQVSKKVNIKGNVYEFTWLGRFGTFVDEYGTMCDVFYNYKVNHAVGRNVGGGDYAPDIRINESFETYCKRFNKHLSHYPDYKEPTATQLSFF